WTDSGWAGIATFDLLVPGRVDDILGRQVLDALQRAPAGQSLDELARSAGRERGEVREAVLAHVQQGLVVHDLAAERFLYRPLFAEPLDAGALRYRDAREEHAHRLLADEGQVRLTHV